MYGLLLKLLKLLNCEVVQLFVLLGGLFSIACLQFSLVISSALITLLATRSIELASYSVEQENVHPPTEYT